MKSNIYCLSVSTCNKVTVARCGVSVFRCVVWFGVLCCGVVRCGVVWCTADERVWRRWLCRDALIVPRFQVPARTQGDQHQCTAVVMIIILWMDCWRCCWLAMMSDKDINIKDLVPDFQFLVIFGMEKFKKKCDYEEQRQRNLNWCFVLVVLSCHSKVFMVMSAIDLSWSNGWKLTPKKGIDQNIGASWPKVLRSDWQVISRAENWAKNLQNSSRSWIIWTQPSWAIT